MNEVFYPLASSTWDESEFDALQRVISSGNFTMGKEVQKFEEQFADKVGAKYAVMTNSGSSANLALMTAARYMRNSTLNDGDVVIAPAVSWSTTYYPIHQLGLSISLVDINKETLNIDIEGVLEAISPRTKAIFTVNLLGNPSDLIKLREISAKNGLLLFEDNCESLGASIGTKQAGTFGLAGTFSSFFSHHISTMEGGITVTDDLDHYQAMKSIRAHGWTRDLPDVNSVYNKTGDDWDDLFRFVLPGYNLRPLELEGALGQSQLLKLDEFIMNRQTNAKFLQQYASRFPHILLQTENGNSSWFGFSLVLTGPLAGKRTDLVRALNMAGIQSRPIVAGNFARNPVMRHLRHEPLPSLTNANFIHQNGLFVGNHHYPMQPQINRLVEVLEEFEEHNVK
jgi:CDP-6-deoxy-D-xylo-4-hexulose-3-dehydrase